MISEKNENKRYFCNEIRKENNKKMTIWHFWKHMLKKKKFYLNKMVENLTDMGV